MKRHCKKESRAVAEEQSGSGQGKGSDTSEFGGREPEKVFTGPEYVFLLYNRSLMKNKNKTTVSSYLILHILASCWPSEAGGLMHSHSGINQAAHRHFDWVYIIPNATIGRNCEIPSGMTGKSTEVMGTTIKLLVMKK